MAGGDRLGNAAKRLPPHVVIVFAAGPRLAPGHARADGRLNGITAMPVLPEPLDLDGRTVTVDAMHAQRATAEAATTAKGGDCVLAPRGWPAGA